MHFGSTFVRSLAPFLMVSTARGLSFANESIEVPPASNVSTGNPAKCNHTSHFFPQKIYHKANSSATGVAVAQGNNTFLQQYQIITDFYRPGGPILLYQGAETPFQCMENWAVYDHAKELGALVASIEHRYYWLSTPFGLKWEDNSNWPTSSLKPLTLENIALDTISFLHWVKATVPGAEKSKAILFGASYAGFLTVHIKNTYPNEFFGAVAASLPVLGQVSDPNDPLMYSIGNQASSILSQMSAKGAARVKRSFESIRRRISQNDLSNMKEQYNLCTQPRNTTEALYILQGFLTAFTYLCEFNFPPFQVGQQNSVPFPAEVAIKAIADLKAPFADEQPIRIGIDYYNQANGQTCLDWSKPPRGGGQLPYSWARCHFLKHPDPYSTADSIFGLVAPDNKTNNVLDAQCQDDFKIDATDGGAALQAELKTSLKDIMGAERLIVSTGEWDSITGSTFPRWAPGPGADETKPFLVGKGAHVSDLIRESEYDRDGVKDARKAELEVMKGWLGIEV
ncbi:serine carboxypeptidase S28-domain-containing protein [Annulohypoxylon moriforme]|nr:serine carboxypeptidase S28-domain-containing protein [Annulohypoxylon moriforme]